jgi:hypothetical protein
MFTAKIRIVGDCVNTLLSDCMLEYGVVIAMARQIESVRPTGMHPGVIVRSELFAPYAQSVGYAVDVVEPGGD